MVGGYWLFTLRRSGNIGEWNEKKVKLARAYIA